MNKLVLPVITIAIIFYYLINNINEQKKIVLTKSFNSKVEEAVESKNVSFESFNLSNITEINRDEIIYISRQLEQCREDKNEMNALTQNSFNQLLKLLKNDVPLSGLHYILNLLVKKLRQERTSCTRCA